MEQTPAGYSYRGYTFNVSEMLKKTFCEFLLTYPKRIYKSPASTVYADYVEWMNEMGYSPAYGRSKFSREMHKVAGLRTLPMKAEEEGRSSVRCYCDE